jgi:hypothetical protein
MFIHSTPISADVFETYFLVIAKTFSAIYSEGLGAIAGPRIADKMLRKVATEMGAWDGPGGVSQGLFAEIRRLTNIMVSGGKGWEMLPYEGAQANGTLDATEASEVDAAIVFFTLASAMHKKTELAEILDGAMKLWGARTESLSCTDFRSSLKTSTVRENSGATVAA